MRVITNKNINLTDYKAEDLIITGNIGSALFLQVEGLTTEKFTISGKNINATGYAAVSGIAMNGFGKIDEIEENGVYMFDVSGFDTIRINIVGTAGNAVLNARVVE